MERNPPQTTLTPFEEVMLGFIGLVDLSEFKQLEGLNLQGGTVKQALEMLKARITAFPHNHRTRMETTAAILEYVAACARANVNAAPR